MQNNIIPIIILLSLLFISCSNNKNDPATSIKTCYQNTYGDNKIKDLEILTITITNKFIKGQYHWLPAFKDKRIGYFKGTKTKQLILAKYDYVQEGIKASTQIQLTLNDKSISVWQEEPALGLNVEIQQIDCTKLTDFP